MGHSTRGQDAQLGPCDGMRRGARKDQDVASRQAERERPGRRPLGRQRVRHSQWMEAPWLRTRIRRPIVPYNDFGGWRDGVGSPS